MCGLRMATRLAGWPKTTSMARMKQLWYPYRAVTTPPYLTDLALSRRLERAEGRAASRFVDARYRFRPEAGSCWTEMAGAYVLYDGVESPMTQTFGLGVSGLPSAEEMQAIEEYFESRGAPVMHEVSPLTGSGHARAAERARLSSGGIDFATGADSGEPRDDRMQA